MKQLYVRVKPFSFNLSAYLYEDGKLVQEYDVIDAADSIAECATELSAEEVILIGNAKYCSKKKTSIERELKELSTKFSYELNIPVRIEEV